MKKRFFTIMLFVVSSSCAMHDSLSLIRMAMLLVPNPQSGVAKKMDSIKEYPHNPQQQLRVKKTQQPHTHKRRQFTQHHK